MAVCRQCVPLFKQAGYVSRIILAVAVQGCDQCSPGTSNTGVQGSTLSATNPVTDNPKIGVEGL